jgi:hypothetical protein
MRVILLAALCLTTVGCGSAAQPTPAPRPTTAVVNADMSRNRFVPPRLALRLGQTVRLDEP